MNIIVKTVLVTVTVVATLAVLVVVFATGSVLSNCDSAYADKNSQEYKACRRVAG